jgi:hypothetical protein
LENRAGPFGTTNGAGELHWLVWATRWEGLSGPARLEVFPTQTTKTEYSIFQKYRRFRQPNWTKIELLSRV